MTKNRADSTKRLANENDAQTGADENQIEMAI
jgi:hypothetical protein